MAATVRILLIQLGFRDYIHPFASPPLGLLYIAGYLRSKYHADIRIICQEVEGCSDDALIRAAADYEPDIIGISCMTPYAGALPYVVEGIRTAMPAVRILLGGPHISAFGKEGFEKTAADAAVIGEGELSFGMYVEAFLDRSDGSHIPGLIRHASGGEVVCNPGDAPIVADLDTLPFPAYDLIDIRRYWRRQSMPPIPRNRYISLLSSRGCPYGCIWCHNLFGRRFRVHSPERVVEEIQHFAKCYQANDFEFIDDCFNLKRDRVIAFSDLLLAKHGPVRIAFPNALRADLLDADTMDALLAAGLFFTALALESGSPRIQEMSNKRLDIEKFVRATELANERRVFTQGFMMLGFPSETEEEMEATINTAAESKLHVGSFFSLVTYPNTPLYDRYRDAIEASGALVDYTNLDFLKARVNLSAVSTEKLLQVHRKAMRRFYSYPDRILRIMRDFPQRHLLYRYLPLFLNRIAKGLLS